MNKQQTDDFFEWIFVTLVIVTGISFLTIQDGFVWWLISILLTSDIMTLAYVISLIGEK